jgi:electron transport complex protein RnfG
MMKVIFNIARPLAGLMFFASLLMLPRSAHAEGVYWSTRDLLADFFRTSTHVTYKKVEMRGELRSRIESRLGYSLPRDSYNIFVATTGEHIDGYALIDEESGEHLPITFAVKLSPQGLLERQEIVIYREPRGDEVRDQRFRRQFTGKSARDALRLGEDLAAISGATISSRAMAVGVKRALVLVEEAMIKSQQLSAAAPPARR